MNVKNTNKISNSLSQIIYNKQNDLLKNVIKQKILDNKFILTLLSFYEEKIALSKQQLDNIINKEKSKFSTKYEWYYKALCSNNIEAIKILFDFCGNDHNSFLEGYELCELFDEALENNNYFFIEKLINYESFNFNRFNIELFLSKKFFKPKKIEQKSSILKFFIECLFKHKQFNFRTINFESILFNIWETGIEELECICSKKNIDLIDFFIKKSLSHKSFDFKNINFQRILNTVCTIQDGASLVKSTINNCFNHETFDFKIIYLENILLRIIEYNNQNNYYNSDLIKLIIEKALHHKTFNSKEINIYNILLILKQIQDDSISISEYFIKELLNYNNIDNLNLKELFIASQEVVNDDFLKYVIKILLKHQKVDFSHPGQIESFLQAAKCIKSTSVFEYFVTLMFNNKTLEFSNINFENILLISCDMNNPYYEKRIVQEAFFNKSCHHEPFDIHTINYEKILLFASQIENIDTMKLLIEKVFNISSLESIKKLNTLDLSIIQEFDIPYQSLILNLLIKLHQLNLIKYIVENSKLQNKMNYNVPDRNNEYPIIVALYSDIEIFKYLLEQGINCNVKDIHGNPLFLLAIKRNNYEILQQLFKYNVPLPLNNVLLINAIYLNDINNVTNLMESHNHRIYSNKDFSFNCFTPLILSYLLNHMDIFKVLVNYLDIDELDYYGYSILHYAILKEDMDTIQFLVDMGANVNYKKNKNSYGHSALDIALRIKNMSIISILLNSVTMSINGSNGKGEPLFITLLKMKNYSVDEKLNLLKQFTEKGLDTNGLDGNESSLFLHFIQFIDIEIIKYLAIHHPSIFTFDIMRDIIYKDRVDLLKLLVPTYFDLNTKDVYGNNLLIYAFDTGNDEIIQYLIHHGSEIIKINNVLIEKLINKDKFYLIKLLIPNYLDYDSKDEDYEDPLTYAIKYENTNIIEYFLKCGADLNAGLHTAISNKKLISLKFLIDYGANINSVDKNNTTSLMNAIYSGDLNILKCVIDAGSDVNNDDLSFIKACDTLNRDMIKYLLDAGFNVNKWFEGGETPLTNVISNFKNEKIIEYLIDLGADVDQPNKYGNTPLICAIHSKNNNIIQYLIKRGADPNLKNSNGETPLIYAIQINNPDLDIIRFLIEHGADVDGKGQNGKTPFYYAVKIGHIDIVKYLIDNGAKIRTKNNTINMDLILAVKNNDLYQVKEVMRKGINTEKNYWGDIPLFYAIENENVAIVNYLVQEGAVVNTGNRWNNNLLNLSIKTKNQEIIKIMVNHGAFLNIIPLDVYDRKTGPVELKDIPPLVLAIQDGDLNLVKYLIDNGAEVYTEYESPDNPLINAIQYGQVEMVKYLIDHEENVHRIDHNLDHALVTSILNRKISMIKCLLDHGANPNITEYYNSYMEGTALILAIKTSNLNLVKYLVEHGADVNYEAIDENDGQSSSTPLIHAIRIQDMPIIKYLLKEGASIYQEDSNFISPFNMINEILNNEEILGEGILSFYYEVKNLFTKIKK